MNHSLAWLERSYSPQDLDTHIHGLGTRISDFQTQLATLKELWDRLIAICQLLMKVVAKILLHLQDMRLLRDLHAWSMSLSICRQIWQIAVHSSEPTWSLHLIWVRRVGWNNTTRGGREMVSGY